MSHPSAAKAPATGSSGPTILATALVLACGAILSGCGGGGSGGGGGGFPFGLGGTTTTTGTGSGTGTGTTGGAGMPGTATPVDALAPATPVDLDKVLAEWQIESTGVGGDAGGDGGVGGTAGDGSPLKRVTVVLRDSTPLPVTAPATLNSVTPPVVPVDPFVAKGTTDSNGRYLLKFNTATVRPPLFVQVIDASGNVLASTTQETVPTGKAIRLNVNPLTDKIMSDVLVASAGGTDRRISGLQVDLAKLATAKANLVASAKAALGEAGIAETTNFDPMRSIYPLDGTGVDAVIESVTHVREPGTGATQLRAKLAALATNADGSVAPTVVTTTSPLAPSAVAINGSPALTFAKINAWMTAMNRCFALPAAARATDATCPATSNLVDPAFKDNSRDLPDAYGLLYSDTGRVAVQGSVLSNPAILLNIAASTNPPELERTLVEFTVDQPATGPLAGSRTTPIRYTIVMAFAKTTNPTAVAGNWILSGNQRRFDVSILPGYSRAFQMNTADRATKPDTLSSLLEIRVATTIFNGAGNAPASAGLRAVRVKGPGLPTAGLVLAPSGAQGAGPYLTPADKLGQVPLNGLNSSSVQPIFAVGIEKTADSQAASPAANAAAAYWAPADPANADTPLADFSNLQAFSRYTFEYFLTASASLAPDLTESVRMLAPLMPPSYLDRIPRNNFAPDTNMFSSTSGGSCSFTLTWNNNPDTRPVDSAFVTDGARIMTSDVDPLVPARPTTASPNTCNTANQVNIEPIDQVPNPLRISGDSATNARSRIYSTARYN
ncbi:conserved hypothetical protein [Burkholderiales bacterium 8X]|nr:conserved hypothetical protein [Burkholderiales bacterium 8X]